MVHVLPFHNYINHGFYNFQPVLFHDLAEANQYNILRVSLGAQRGQGNRLRRRRHGKYNPRCKTYA